MTTVGARGAGRGPQGGGSSTVPWDAGWQAGRRADQDPQPVAEDGGQLVEHEQAPQRRVAARGDGPPPAREGGGKQHADQLRLGARRTPGLPGSRGAGKRGLAGHGPGWGQRRLVSPTQLGGLLHN